MCGIAGLVDFAGAVDPRERLARLNRMSLAVAHRGPDGDGTYVDDVIGLAHRRLSVVGLGPQGSQPMASADGRFVLVYNGEIYNAPALRRRLRADGADFAGTSDTEVLLRLLERRGLPVALDDVEGMFAFALWDRVERTLSLVRDRFGEKPLYLGARGGVLAFASEIDAVVAGLGGRVDVDPEGRRLLFSVGAIPAPRSIYLGIEKLRAGRWLRLDARGRREQALPGLPASFVEDAFGPHGSFEDVVDAAGAAIDAAVADCAVADVEVGAFLSSGIDSTLVVESLTRCSGHPVRTFTARVGGDDDESDAATRVAAALGTVHETVDVGEADALAAADGLGQWLQEPLGDSSLLVTHAVSEAARRRVKVVVSGDGGDEVFGGYVRYRQWMLLERLGRLAPLLGAAAEPMLAALPSSTVVDKGRKLAAMLRTPARAARYRHLVHTWPDIDIEGAFATSPSSRAALAFARHADLEEYLPEVVLPKVDRASMAVALEVRSPLLHRSLLSVARTWPPHFFVGDGGKRVLRALVLRGRAPFVAHLRKRGFAVPLERWLRGPLRDWAAWLLHPDALGASGVDNIDEIVRLWREHDSGRRRWHQRLWPVLVYQRWWLARVRNGTQQ